MHRRRGFLGIGYHYVIRRDGKVEFGRPTNKPGAHVRGHNAHSIAICLVGGLDPKGKAEDNFTEAQYESLYDLLNMLDYPRAEILGHRDLSPDLNKDGKITSNEWLKQCPCFDVREWLLFEKLERAN